MPHISKMCNMWNQTGGGNEEFSEFQEGVDRILVASSDLVSFSIQSDHKRPLHWMGPSPKSCLIIWDVGIKHIWILVQGHDKGAGCRNIILRRNIHLCNVQLDIEGFQKYKQETAHLAQSHKYWTKGSTKGCWGKPPTTFYNDRITMYIWLAFLCIWGNHGGGMILA